MHADFWDERWRSGRIGFHQPAVQRGLEEFWPALGIPTASRVLVPLCGKSVDLKWLRDAGFFVSGVELSDIAVQAFCLEQGISARRRRRAAFELYESNDMQLFQGDFFALTRELCGSIAAVYDRAALVSFAPGMRQRYVDHLTALTEPGTETLLITVDYPQHQMTGPPFSVDAGDIQRLYGDHHIIRELGRRDTLAEEARLRARGVSRLSDVCYRLTRV